MNTDLNERLDEYIDQLSDLLEEMGLRLTVGNDFHYFRHIPLHQPLRPHVAPIFDPAVSEIDPQKAFWLTASAASGEVVHTQAMQLIDLGNQTLGQHLTKNLAAYRPYGNVLDPTKSVTRQTMATSSLKGRVCYHGELWTKGGRDGYRGGSLTALLPRLMISKAVRKWAPDHVFGVMEPGAACKGLAAREGYMHLEQGSVLWHDTRSGSRFEEWIVWMNREDTRHLLSVGPHVLYNMFENDRMFTPALAEKAKRAG